MLLHIAALLAICMLVGPNARADWTFTVTNTTSAVIVPANQNGPFTILVRENSATPTAVFTVWTAAPGGAGTGALFAAGGSYTFTRQTGFPFLSGDTIGYIQASTAGPFTFLAQTIAGPGAVGGTGAGVMTVQGASGATAIPVSGTFWQATQPVSGTVAANAGTGTFTVGQATGANLHMVCDSGCSSSAGFADNSTFTVGTTSINPIGGYYTTGADPTLTSGDAARARIDSHSYLFTDLATPLPAGTNAIGSITNTSFAATQSGTWTVEPGNTANTTAWLVTGTGGTFPVTGTVTANIGTSGSLALDASVTGLQVAQASTTSGQKGGLIQGAVTTAAPAYTTAETSPLSLNTSGGLRVDGSGVTQPVSAASLPLPSGASTSAKQPALGTAGVASSDVITVQGIASMTKLLVTPDSVALPANQSVNVSQIAGTNTVTGGVAGILAVGGNVANAGTATANPVPVGGVFTTTPTTLTTGQTATLQFTSAQRLIVDGSQVTQPVSGTVTTTPPSNASTNVTQIAGTAASTGNGTSNAGDLRVNIASDNTAFSVNNTQQGTASQNVAQIGGTAVVADPCQANVKSYVSINQTAGAQLVAGTAAKKIYPCSINLVTATAQNIALVEGTGTVCATGTTGVLGFGGATAATGWNFAANGGVTYGNGASALGQEGTAADNLCLLQSGTGQVSGGLSYVVQ